MQRKPAAVAAVAAPAASEVNDKDREAKPVAVRRDVWKLGLTLVLCVLLGYAVMTQLFAASSSDDDDGIEDMPPPPSRPPVERKKKLLGDAEVVQVTSSAGWSPQLGALVEKRPPRPCATTRIAVNVFDPIIYLNKNWKRRAYACHLGGGTCRRSLVEDAEDRRWKLVKNYDATFIFTSAAQLSKLSDKDFKLVYREREGSTYLDVILGGPSLSGGIVAQVCAHHG